MDQVNASIKALHSAASNKKQRRDVGDALEQISSVAKLLVISYKLLSLYTNTTYFRACQHYPSKCLNGYLSYFVTTFNRCIIHFSRSLFNTATPCFLLYCMTRFNPPRFYLMQSVNMLGNKYRCLFCQEFW